MNGDIDKLIAYLEEHFVYDEKRYPELHGATEEERLKYALRHSALHFAKVAGKMAAVSEAIDHGAPINMEELRSNVPKAFINTLRLAGLVGTSEADMIAAIEKKYGAIIPNT